MLKILIKVLFTNGHNVLHNDLKVQITDYFDPNNPQKQSPRGVL